MFSLEENKYDKQEDCNALTAYYRLFLINFLNIENSKILKLLPLNMQSVEMVLDANTEPSERVKECELVNQSALNIRLFNTFVDYTIKM